MIQFTVEEQQILRERSQKYPQTVEKLKEDVKEIYENEILVPHTGLGNWTLYYYCPDCSVLLEYNRKSPKEHRCPNCKKILSGEPYNGAWWGFSNTKNSVAVFQMAVLWLVTGERSYAEKSIAILKEYATYYPDYEVHGDIPYNGPGRVGAQTLDEANFQRNLAMCYDIVSELMTEEEINWVKERLFLPAAEFLLEHRHKQLHNHEVIINSTIAVLGILFEKEDYINQALNDKYGLIYQLEQGVMENDIWFEGAFSYHFYALQSFFAFEKFALHTKYSQMKHPNYRKMMEVAYYYLEPDYSLPMLNDSNYGHASQMKNLYEFAYRELGGDKIGFILKTAYMGLERDNFEAFLYGVEELPDIELPLVEYHTEMNQSGHSILRGQDNRYLLFKHDAYGGEHDHYDRLGISYIAYNQDVSRDLGTTGYGAKLHYQYYKNTGSHNTVVIGEENQAPANAILTNYQEHEDYVEVEAKVDWTAPYQMPDSFTIVQWSEQNYKTVVMRRKILWFDNYFVEVFWVNGAPEGETVDWVWHIHGQEQNPVLDGESHQFEKKPFCYLTEVRKRNLDKNYERLYQHGQSFTKIYGWGQGQALIEANGFDNPSTHKMPYLIERVNKENVVFAHVIESWQKKSVLEKVDFKVEGNKLIIDLVEEGKSSRRFEFLI